METRTLGQGLEVSALGLGCMGMSEGYGATDWDGAITTIRRALDLGVTLIDTADAYGAGHNEVLVGRAIAGRRSEVRLATKVGIDRSNGDDTWVLRWPGVDKRSRDLISRGIDHIFVSPGTSVTDAQYLPDPESDHPAVTADIEW